jgi:phosphoribosylanthranilate isomerase
MSLKTVVKAGNITNLSDARYFAGMGVEIIGFPVGKTSVNVLEPSKIKEIAGWISGVKIALEIQDSDLDEQWVQELLKELLPDYIQLTQENVEKFRKLSSIPLLIVTDQLSLAMGQNDYLVYTGKLLGNELLAHYCIDNPVILSGEEIEASGIMNVLNTIKPYGIELKGSSEISPGLKDFEELSEILELLEVDE